MITIDNFGMFVIEELGHQLESRGEKVIRLTLGKTELLANPQISLAATEAIREPARSNLVYPEGIPDLRAAISRNIKQRRGKDVPAEQIIVSVGTSTLFRNLFSLLVEPQDVVLLPKPFYPLYTVCAQLQRARIHFYDVSLETRQVDMQSLRRGMEFAPALVVVNSPGNPLGNVISDSDIAEIDAIVAGRAYIISDEMYGNVVFDGAETSFLHLQSPRSTIIVTDGFSKGHRMYTRRVGYGIVPPQLAKGLIAIQQNTLLTTDPVSQYAAIAALGCQEDVAEIVSVYRARRNYTMNAFEGMRSVQAIPASGGFYITLDCTKWLAENGGADSLALSREILHNTHVAVTPGDDFGARGTLRLSFCSQDYCEAIDRLCQFFKTC